MSVSNPAADTQRASRPRVGYVMTHYPKLAQTFIANEIDAVERTGTFIECFAMNPPDDRERQRPGAAARIARTHYLKPELIRGLAILLLQSAKHPIAMAQVWGKALASAGGQPARMVRRIAHLAQAALIAREIPRLGIERLHAHFGLAPATIAWFATGIARAQGIRAVEFSFTIHGFHDFFDPGETRLDLKTRDATAVLCISDFTRSQLCLTTPHELWDRFHVARCGIDTGAFAFREPGALAEPPTIMALGRLSAEKGFAVLIDALQLLHRDGRRANLRIVGDGPMRDELGELARRAGLSGAVTFTGELTPAEVSEELAASDLFCMASFSEGLPISIMEAMAIGVPVVSTWISGIPELARNGETALTVPPASTAELARAISRLLDDTGLRNRLTRAARARVEQQHDLEVCGRKVAELLKARPDE